MNRQSMFRSHDGDERGQVLAIVAMGMIGIIAMVGLVIDGGFAWAQQRETQNGADAVAFAGATVIQQSIAGTARTDGDVGCAVEQAAEANGVEMDAVVYTDAFGAALVPEVAVGACVPPPAASLPIPETAQGVRDVGSQQFETFLMQVVGFKEMTATANAAAVVGRYAGATGSILPVTIPLSFSTCDSSLTTYTVGEGAWAFRPTAADRTSATLVTLPLCDAGPGSVGWLDMGCRSNIAEFITNPCELSIPIPDWLHTQTGNVNNLEDLIRDYSGADGNPASWGIADDSIVSIPIHTNTCDVDPGALSYCPPTNAPANQWKGNGDNLYYYIDGWVGFMVDQAHTSGGDQPCRQAPGTPVLVNPTPAGKVGCLKGWFVEQVTPGPIVVGEIDPDEPGAIGVTLVN